MARFLACALLVGIFGGTAVAGVEPFPAAHVAFEQFGAFGQDAVDNKQMLAKDGKIAMPILAIGAEKSFGAGMADDLRFVASDVTAGIVPNSGHWIMEENPQATIKLVTDFLAK